MTALWIVVADSGSARIFAADKTDAHWQEIADLTHAEGRMQGSDMDTERPGRSHDSHGPGRHAMEPHQTRKTKEAGVFARQISDYLKQNDSKYEKLILVCAPRFLGQLRKQLDKTTTKKVSKEVSIDVVHEKIDKIRTLVLDNLP